MAWFDPRVVRKEDDSMNDRIQRHRIGEVSSKYGYQPEQFDEDLKKRGERSNRIWEDFQSFVKDHDMTPDECRTMFVRFYEEFMA